MDWSKILGWAVGIGGGLFGWLWKGHENRLTSLETTRVLKADADHQRQELRDEIKEFRGDITGRFEALRADSSGRFERLSSQLTEIAGRLPRKQGR
jgi:hypothetical protein